MELFKITIWTYLMFHTALLDGDALRPGGAAAALHEEVSSDLGAVRRWCRLNTSAC